MPATDAQLAWVDALMDGAVLLGVELDTQYRVLGATVEPGEGRHPDDAGEAGDPQRDRRLQVLAHPCAAITAVLFRDDDGERVVERFTAEQLPAVVAALDDPELSAPIVTRTEAPQLPEDVSLHGESSAPDGRTHRLVLDVSGGDRRLVLSATFDELEVRDPGGETVALPT